MNNGFLHRVSLLVVPTVYSFLARLLFATCRVENHGTEYHEQCMAGGPYIILFWHYGIYYVIHRATGEPWTAMVSASSDGEYISRVLENKGFVTIRGSRGKRKGSVPALKGMVAEIENGRCAAIVGDGSQGPARVLQPGAILLASKSGVPILPVSWSADRYHSFKSWDRSVLPFPFARIVFYFGEPFRVPPGIRGDELEKYRLELENRLNGLYEKAWSRFGRSEH